MNTACIDCQQRLSEVFRNNAEGEALPEILPAELHQHLAHCPTCRQEWELLQTIRSELRALPQLTAPPELRGRISQQLTKTPQATSNTAAQSTLATPSLLQQWRERLSSFYRKPFAIAWASGVAVAIFGFAVLLRPYSETEVLLPEHSESYTIPQPMPEEPKQSVEEKSSTQNPVPSPLRAQAKTENQTSESPPQETPSSPPKPSKSSAAPSPKKPRRSSASPQSTPTVKKPITETIKKTPSQEPVKEKQPVPPSPAVMDERSAEPETESRIPAPEKTVPAEKESSPQGFSPSPQSGPSGPSGPFQSPDAPAAALMRRRAFPVPQEEEHLLSKTTLLRTKKIQAEFLALENMQEAQITLTLPEDVRLKPAEKSLVLWQGKTNKEKPVKLSFEIEAAPGTYIIELILQEIREKSLETVASQTVVVTVSNQPEHQE